MAGNFFDEPAPAAPDAPTGNFFDEPPPVAPKAPSSAPIYLEPRSLSQVGSDIANFGRVAANTLGIGDSLIAVNRALYHDIVGDAKNPNTVSNLVTKEVTGQGNANDYLTNLAAEKAKTAQASQDIGPAASFAANIVGGAPVAGMTGKTLATGLAPYIPKFLGGRWTAGVLGSAGENALTATAAAAGRGDPIQPAATVGGLLGALVGLPGGVTGRGVLPPTPSADVFDQAAQRVYGDMRQVGIHPPIIDQAYSSATPTLTKSQLSNISPEFMTLIKRQRRINDQGNMTSADSVDGFGRALQNAARTPADRVLAGRISDNLDDVLKNAPTLTGHVPGYASDLQDQANQAIAQRNDLNRITEWQTAAKQGGRDVSDQATSYLNSVQGKRFAPPGSPVNQAFQTIGDTTAKPGYLPYWAKKYVIPSLLGATVGEGVHYLTGDENTVEGRVLEDMAMAAAFGGGSHAYGQMTGGVRSAAQQRAIDAAKATVGSGQLYSPVKAPNQTADMLRRLYSQMVPGALPGTSSH